MTSTEKRVYGLTFVFLFVMIEIVEAEPLNLTLELGAYANMNLYPEDKYAWQANGSPVATIKLRWGNSKFGCEYMHVSNWFSGVPFNDDAESTLDALGCAVRVKLL